jgi:pimeloyl-ACP methyl ester carboxylesterase
LLVIQGGGGTADASDGIASVLDGEFRIISFDRRGLLRSPLDDPQEALSIERHAWDALALLDALGVESAYVFGSSLGALIGLELLRLRPDRVRLLVAHEPPAASLLADAERAAHLASRREVLATALQEGPRAAMRKALEAMGVDAEDREQDCEPPASSRAQSRETAFLLSREVRTTDAYKLDVRALKRWAARIVPAFGSSSAAFYPAACARALASALGRRAAQFPGGHNGYVLRPRAFGETLRSVLHTSQRESGFSQSVSAEGLERGRKAEAG